MGKTVSDDENLLAVAIREIGSVLGKPHNAKAATFASPTKSVSHCGESGTGRIARSFWLTFQSDYQACSAPKLYVVTIN
jgi:hypothetical protein